MATLCVKIIRKWRKNKLVWIRNFNFPIWQQDPVPKNLKSRIPHWNNAFCSTIRPKHILGTPAVKQCAWNYSVHHCLPSILQNNRSYSLRVLPVLVALKSGMHGSAIRNRCGSEERIRWLRHSGILNVWHFFIVSSLHLSLYAEIHNVRLHCFSKTYTV